MYVDDHDEKQTDYESAAVLLAKAKSGEVAVDPTSGQAILEAMAQLQQEVERVLRRGGHEAKQLKLGGGYAEQMNEFNADWTAGGDGSAQRVFEQFRDELVTMQDAIRASIDGYAATDQEAAARMDSLGRDQ